MKVKSQNLVLRYWNGTSQLRENEGIYSTYVDHSLNYFLSFWRMHVFVQSKVEWTRECVIDIQELIDFREGPQANM